MNPKTTPRDFFLHLGATIVLYVAAGALITLSFRVIDYFFPDVLAGYFYGNAVAVPISILVVLVPTLYVIEWLINRDIVRFPEKRDIWIRRWRIYLTLFLASILMAGDLIALINTYLNGEISARFVYKIIAIILITGCIGKYYFYSLYPNFRWATIARKGNAWFGIILTLAAIVIGFIAVGSPATQRALRFDNERVNDLTSIQWQVINDWTLKGELPATLDDLNDEITGFIVPKDPESDESYGYSIKTPAGTAKDGEQVFELCADFSRATKDTKGRGEFGGGGLAYPSYDMMSYRYPGGEESVWKHDAGLTCFERVIDPERYPVSEPAVMKGI